MLALEVKTRKKPGDVVNQAIDYFGPKGYKLQVSDKTDTYATFEGGGGGVSVTTSTDGKLTSVELTSREWDYQIKEFAGKIK